MEEKTMLFALASNRSSYFVSTFDIHYMALNTITQYSFQNKRIATYALSYLPATQITALENYLIVATDCITVFDLRTGKSRKSIQDSVFPLSRFKLVKINDMYQLVAFSELKIYCLRFKENMTEDGEEMWPLFHQVKPGQAVVFVDSICGHRVYFAIYNVEFGSYVRFGVTEQTLFNDRQTACVQPRICCKQSENCDGQLGIAEWDRFLSRRAGGSYAQVQAQMQWQSSFYIAEYLTVDVENNLYFLQISYDDANPSACTANWIKCDAIPTCAGRHVLKIDELPSGQLIFMDELSVCLCDMNTRKTTALYTAKNPGIIYNFHVLQRTSGRRETTYALITGLGLIEQVPLQ